MMQPVPPSTGKTPYGLPPTPPAPTVPPPPPPPPSRGTKRRVEKESSVKETIESILVAFILAFIFRAFVVEAFVIPTGSMAPTLLGAHMRFTCNDCGYNFDANYSDQSGSEEIRIPTRSPYKYRIFCPNCGYKLPEIDTDRPEVHYGDRILVLKYLYLLEEPRRWDVVVFKSPYEPEKYKYEQNYIKRLVGKPNESVLILDGDIFVGQPGQEVEEYTIQTKPRHVQDVLWRVIYNNDYVPRRLMRSDGSKWEQPWKVREGTGWELGDTPTPDGRIFRFENAAGAGTIGFDPSVNPIAERINDPRPYAFTDWLAYDIEQPVEHNIVSDLKLSFVYDRAAGDGALRATLTRGGESGDEFIAVITPTEARLVHRNKGRETIVGQPYALPASGRPLRVELTNVDYQAALRIDDVEVARTTPEDYRPDINALIADFALQRQQPLPTVEISAESQTAALSHIGLWRDIYYINRAIAGSSGGSVYWGTPTRLPDSIMHLGPDEYFVLGDNSLISGDARYWRDPIDLPADQLQVQSGRVPGRFMLGRAFFVYWPAGYRPAARLPGLVPHFGGMRFIR